MDVAASRPRSTPGGYVKGKGRKRERDRGHALAGKSTLNRRETAAPIVDRAERSKKIRHDDHAGERLFVSRFLDAHERPRKQIIIDLNATDDPVHGEQEGRPSTRSTANPTTCPGGVTQHAARATSRSRAPRSKTTGPPRAAPFFLWFAARSAVARSRLHRRRSV